MNCPKCKCSRHCKAGKALGKQRYKCKECGYHYTVERKSDVKTEDTRRLAFEMYLESLGFRAIGRILKISKLRHRFPEGKKMGGESELLPKRSESVAVVELDELHTYVGSKLLLI